jgi:cyclic pyranopterin phosphate synthase
MLAKTPAHTHTVDTLGRSLRDLRISVTDRCNFRCTYCMPKEIFGPSHQFLDRREVLSFEEIERIARAFALHGVRKLRLTGGEPLVRRDLETLIEKLAAIADIDDISLTTNGSLLSAAKARSLYDAGLKRVTISLDALDDAKFKAVNDVGFPVERVLAAIDNAAAAGLAPVKINMVVKKGVNDGDILPMARYFHGSGHILRFIEYMDVGASNGWRLDEVVPVKQIADIINAELPITPTGPNYRGEVAKRWRYLDDGGEIGIISSVTQPFCGNCTRARLSAEGKIYTCLFATQGYDLRAELRAGMNDAELCEWVGRVWRRREDRYSEIRTFETHDLPIRAQKIEMSYIGG